MSSLIPISHHLFVAAVRKEARHRRRLQRQEPAAAVFAENSPAIPLELLGRTPSSAVGMARQLRASGPDSA
jgi:hypothetical protein